MNYRPEVLACVRLGLVTLPQPKPPLQAYQIHAIKQTAKRREERAKKL